MHGEFSLLKQLSLKVCKDMELEVLCCPKGRMVPMSLVSCNCNRLPMTAAPLTFLLRLTWYLVELVPDRPYDSEL